jgi:cbb3-type cytochrome oxidase subunit 3
MTLLFVLFVGWACRPGSKQQQDKIARTIFAEDETHG